MSKPQQPDANIEASDFINKATANATPSNDEGRVPVLESNGRLHPDFLAEGGELASTFETYDSFNASALPVPMCIETVESSLIRSDANVAGQDTFLGFSKANVEVIPLVFSDTTTATTVSIEIPAGENLCMVVYAFTRSTGGSPAIPTAVAWNSISIPVVQSNTGESSLKAGIFVEELGTLAVATTANLVLTGFSGTIKQAHIYVFSNVNQTTPVANSQIASNTSTSLNTASITQTLPASTFVVGGVTLAVTLNTLSVAGATAVNTLGSGSGISGLARATAAGVASMAVSTSGLNILIGLSLNAAATLNIPLQYSGVIGGFTGLTIGAKYYVSNTLGLISTTPGAATLLVGKALSATELLILHN